MKRFQRICACTLMLCVALNLCPALGAGRPEARLGEDMPDFSVTVLDGRTFQLSQVLKEKEAVLINLWATWCGYCVLEFPFLQEAYEQYGDQVEIIALSAEPTDTPQVLRSFVEAHAMTFPVGSDSETSLDSYFSVSGHPTSIAVDRFGKVVFVQTGAFQSADAVKRLFAALTDSRYTESRAFYELPAAEVTVSPADPAALSAALNADGGEIAFSNADDPAAWPMLPVEKDGRKAVMSSNAGADGTYAQVSCVVYAREGDALAFDFAASTEPQGDIFSVWVDGARAKAFSGAHDWTVWALPLAAGSHAVDFRYEKDGSARQGEDAVWLDRVYLVSGDEAAALLAALPAYPAADAVSFLVTTPGAREIVFDDPDGVVSSCLGSMAYWVVPGDSAEVLLTVTRDFEPEAAFLYSNYDGQMLGLSQAVSGGGYAVSTGLNSLSSTGYVNTTLALYPSTQEETRHDITLFSSEEDLDLLVEYLKMDNPGAELSWTWAETGKKTYRVLFRDQNGEKVPGCAVNFCTDDTCRLVMADANGAAVFTGDPFPYHLQVIRIPAGYALEAGAAAYTSLNGGDITLTLLKQ